MPSLVVVESPYSGDIKANVEYMLECLHDSYYVRGEAPIASHALYTRFPQVQLVPGAEVYQGHVEDNGVAARHGREHGIKCGDAWTLKADLVAVYTDRGITPGMQHRIDFCNRNNIPVEHRSLKDKRPQIIGLVGRAGSGKDSVVEILKEYTDKKVTSFACADALKRGCSVLYGIPLEHFYDRKLKETVVPLYNKTPRQICQWLGTGILRNQVSKSFHVDRLKIDLDACIRANEHEYIFITDIRFEEEAKMVQELGGSIIYVNADQRLGPLPPNVHESERHIAFIGKEYSGCQFLNNGTFEQYKERVLAVFE